MTRHDGVLAFTMSSLLTGCGSHVEKHAFADEDAEAGAASTRA